MSAIKPGVELIVDGSCGCQFAKRPLRVRLIQVIGEASIGPHLLWVLVYQLSYWGDAVCSRELLVDRAAFERAARFGVVRRRKRPELTVPRPRKEVTSRAPAV